MENVHFSMGLRADGRREVANDGFVEGWGQGEIVEFIGRVLNFTTKDSYVSKIYRNRLSCFIILFCIVCNIT